MPIRLNSETESAVFRQKKKRLKNKFKRQSKCDGGGSVVLNELRRSPGDSITNLKSQGEATIFNCHEQILAQTTRYFYYRIDTALILSFYLLLDSVKLYQH